MFVQRPLGKVLDFGHPLAYGLRGAYMGQHSGSTITNLLNGKVISGGAYTVYNSDGSLKQAVCEPTWAQNSTFRRAQAFSIWFKTGSSVTTAQCLFGYGGAFLNTGDYATVGLRIKNGLLRGCIASGYGLTEWFDNLTTAVAINTEYIATFVFDAWVNGTTGYLWVNEVLKDSYTCTAVGDYSCSGLPLAIGTSGDANQMPFLGKVYIALYHNYRLPDSYIQMFHQNPYGIIKNPQSFLPKSRLIDPTRNAFRWY